MEPALRALAPQAVVRRCVSGSFAWQRRAGVFLIPMISGTMPPVCALSVLGFSRPPAGVRLLSAHPGGALRKLLRLVPSSAQLFVLLRSLGRPERGAPSLVKLRATRTCRRPCERALQEALTQRRLGVSVSLGVSVERRMWLNGYGVRLCSKINMGSSLMINHRIIP